LWAFDVVKLPLLDGNWSLENNIFSSREVLTLLALISALLSMEGGFLLRGYQGCGSKYK
jgi:hypothetical protein